MDEFNIQIDHLHVAVNSNMTIMQAADSVGIHIPRLCYHPALSTEGACRICVVEVKGQTNFPPACATKVQKGMEVITNSTELHQIRRDIVELLLDNHPQSCLTCERNGNCELQNLAYTMGVRERLFEGERKRYTIENSSPSLIRDSEKCILCKRCVRVCAEVQGVYNLGQHYRGVNSVVTPAFETNFDQSVCINCGQCVNVCPTASLTEHKSTDDVWRALNDPQKHVVVQIAPAIRAALGEGFGLPVGTPVTGKLISALRRLGFDAIFDTDFGADLTIIEESHEFLQRLNSKQNLPMITSCSPGWIKYLEHFYPEQISLASSCKSPMSMVSTMVKTYYAQKKNIDPNSIVNVAIMPCTAKKFEAQRPELQMKDNIPYTDYVLTTRELIWMIKSFGISFNKLPEGEFDLPLGASSGAGVIFGVTGGVMEAALRTAVEKISGKSSSQLEFHEVRDSQGLKEVSVAVEGKQLNLVIANGLHHAKIVLDKIKNKECNWHMVEIMACPGGCIAGGGQPMINVDQEAYPLDPEIIKKRTEAIYTIDKKMSCRRSHQNPAINELYNEFIGEIGGKKAHQLLHTSYQQRSPRGIN